MRCWETRQRGVSFGVVFLEKLGEGLTTEHMET
jgi:hypothetical protein